MAAAYGIPAPAQPGAAATAAAQRRPSQEGAAAGAVSLMASANY